MDFEDKVKPAKLQTFLNQEALAMELGVIFVTVNRWETGKLKPNYFAPKAFLEFCVKNDIAFEE